MYIFLKKYQYWFPKDTWRSETPLNSDIYKTNIHIDKKKSPIPHSKNKSNLCQMLLWYIIKKKTWFEPI